jgi:hypothetical protein
VSDRLIRCLTRGSPNAENKVGDFPRPAQPGTLQHGRKPEQLRWDYQPLSDASQQYVRNTKTLDELEAAARFPRVAQE